jgi:hypothetical protein
VPTIFVLRPTGWRYDKPVQYVIAHDTIAGKGKCRGIMLYEQMVLVDFVAGLGVNIR